MKFRYSLSTYLAKPKEKRNLKKLNLINIDREWSFRLTCGTISNFHPWIGILGKRSQNCPTFVVVILHLLQLGGKLQSVWLLLPQFVPLYSCGSACSKEATLSFSSDKKREENGVTHSFCFFILPYISNPIISSQVSYADINL